MSARRIKVLCSTPYGIYSGCSVDLGGFFADSQNCLTPYGIYGGCSPSSAKPNWYELVESLASTIILAHLF